MPATPEWFRTYFQGYFDKNRGILHEKYLRLIEGLDEDGRRHLQLLLSRLMKAYLHYGWGNLSFEQTAEEAEMVRSTKDELNARTIEFPNGVWAFQDWLMPVRDVSVGTFQLRCFIEELDALEKLRGKDILDIGAFTGDSALVFHGYTDKNVYAFDPNPKHIKIVKETIRLNGAARIIPVPLGMGDKVESTFMPDAVSQISTFTDSGVPVKITTLDAWAAEHPDVEIGMIKVDIEGYEQNFLRGALETLAKHRPALLLSVNHNASDLFEIKPFIESLGLGYRFKLRHYHLGLAIGEVVLVCEAE
jgi:FkbM family methyltransferase